MSREVVVRKWCDGDHDPEGPTIATVERVMAVDGGKPVLLDLCEVHDKAVQDLLAMMANGAALPARSKPGPKPGTPRGPRRVTERDRPFSCNRCEHRSPNRAALGQHVRTVHHMTLREAGL